MPSFGEKLKLQREKRNMTLEEISASTKIGTRMLQALEEEKFNQLPGGIFNKGFVRAYARMVGLDEDQTVADYLEASGDAVPIRPDSGPRDGSRDAGARDNASRDGSSRETSSREAMARENEARISRLEAISDAPPRPLPWGVFAVILLAIALALSLWSHRRREQERLTSHPAAPKTAVESPAVQPSTMPATQDTSAAAMTTAANQQAPPATNSDSTSTPTASSGLNPPIGSSQSSLNPTEAVPTANPGEFTVSIHARDECWISIAADHKPVPSEILPPGSDRTIHGRKEVVIKAGNVGALDIRLNGKKLDVGGDFQQVKTITIGPAGLLPTPSTSPQSP